MKTYFDTTGDGGSDVLGQVLALRGRIAAALEPVRHLVAVGSGKGGVGKSTLAMALAQELLRTGDQVAILDADLNGPSQARLAGLEEVPWVPGPAGLALPRRADGLGVVSLGSILERDRELRFTTVSSGEQQTWRATRELALFSQLLGAVAWGSLDTLLIDLPPGAERTVQFAELLGPRAAFVLVTVPSELARGVVARSLSALTTAGARVLGVIENMAGYHCRGCGRVQPLFPQAAVLLPVRTLGRVPFDPELAALCDRGWPADREPPAVTGALADAAAALRTALEESPTPAGAGRSTG